MLSIVRLVRRRQPPWQALGAAADKPNTDPVRLASCQWIAAWTARRLGGVHQRALRGSHHAAARGYAHHSTSQLTKCRLLAIDRYACNAAGLIAIAGSMGARQVETNDRLTARCCSGARSGSNAVRPLRAGVPA